MEIHLHSTLASYVRSRTERKVTQTNNLHNTSGTVRELQTPQTNTMEINQDSYKYQDSNVETIIQCIQTKTSQN